MHSPFDWVYDLRRRFSGRYSLDDPRPVAREAPYTFFLPSEATLSALAPGDLAKLVFRSDPPGLKWDAERMWVTIVEITPDGLVGELTNKPFDIPQLKLGQRVAFQRHHVIDVDWADADNAPEPDEDRQVWDRCMVDSHVVDGDARVGYLYREEPDLAQEGDRYPDSGWRIRADLTGLDEADVEARGPTYIAIGKVLNKDDSWLHLLHEPIGSAFFRDPESGLFVAVERAGGEED